MKDVVSAYLMGQNPMMGQNQLSGFSNPKAQALLAAGSAMAQASGWQPGPPRGLMQIVGQGVQAGMGAYNTAQQQMFNRQAMGQQLLLNQAKLASLQAKKDELKTRVVPAGAGVYRDGKIVTSQPKDETTAMMKNFASARKDGYTGTLTDFMRETRATIERTPTGFRPTKTGLEEIPGGPKDPKVIARQESAKIRARNIEEKKVMQPKAFNALRSFERQQGIVNSTIDKALGLVSAWSTGWGARLFKDLPATPAFELERAIETIRANVGFDQLQHMRANSPSGGALGQVSEKENRLLQAVKGSLEPELGPEGLKANLEQIKKDYAALLKERQAAYNQDYGEASTSEKQPPAKKKRPPEMSDAEIIKQALNAIEEGKPREAVEQRLRELGIDPKRLKDGG